METIKGFAVVCMLDNGQMKWELYDDIHKSIEEAEERIEEYKQIVKRSKLMPRKYQIVKVEN